MSAVIRFTTGLFDVTRAARGVVHHSDHDVVRHDDDDSRRRFLRHDGKPSPEE